ncbi:MAG: AEC family transporter [Acidaminococcales bacterium]|nr:AEC family transporter [Acidaminococcales bacterium]
MEIIFHSIQSVISIGIMLGMGLVISLRGWIDDGGAKLISSLVTKISLPCMVLLNITNSFTRENFLLLFHELLIPVLSVVISYYIGSAVCRLRNIPKGRRAIFKSMFYVSNCMYIGLPLNIALFGEDSSVYVFEYFIANTTALWCVAVYQAAAEGSGCAAQIGVLDTLKKIIFSPLIGLITAAVVIALGLKIPAVLKSTLGYIGGMTTPLAMIFVGFALSKTKISELKMDADMLIAHIGRFVIGPVSIFCLSMLIPTNPMQFKVLVMQSAAPVAVALPVIAATYGLDVKYAAILTSASTFFFMFVVPAYMWLLYVYFNS